MWPDGCLALRRKWTFGESVAHFTTKQASLTKSSEHLADWGDAEQPRGCRPDGVSSTSNCIGSGSRPTVRIDRNGMRRISHLSARGDLGMFDIASNDVHRFPAAARMIGGDPTPSVIGLARLRPAIIGLSVVGDFKQGRA